MAKDDGTPVAFELLPWAGYGFVWKIQELILLVTAWYVLSGCDFFARMNLGTMLAVPI